MLIGTVKLVQINIYPSVLQLVRRSDISRLALCRLWQQVRASKYKNKSPSLMFLVVHVLPHSLHICYSAGNKLFSGPTMLYMYLILLNAVKGEIKDKLLQQQ
jgi:hypothetical protein